MTGTQKNVDRLCSAMYISTLCCLADLLSDPFPAFNFEHLIYG